VTEGLSFKMRLNHRFLKVYDGWSNENRYIDYDNVNIGSFSTMILN